MNAEQLIGNINSGALNGEFDEHYMTSEVMENIVRYIENDHLSDPKAWKALGSLYRTYDGDTGILGPYTIYVLASSSIPLRQWYDFINSPNNPYSSYEDLKQQLIAFYRQPAWVRAIDPHTKEVIGGSPSPYKLAIAKRNRQIVRFFEQDKRTLSP